MVDMCRKSFSPVPGSGHVLCCVTLSVRLPDAVGTFLRGVLDKVGIEPQVQRIGECCVPAECAGCVVA